MAAYIYSNQDVNRFWLPLMGDNALLLRDALLPASPEDSKKAGDFIARFDNLSNRAGQTLTDQQLTQLNKDAYQAVQDFRQFALEILRAILEKGLAFTYKPAIVNHIISMAEEYAYLLNTFMQGQQPLFDPVRQDTFWLYVFQFYNRYIADNVGYYQTAYREKAREFVHRLNDLWMSAIEYHGFSRIGTTNYPMYTEYRSQVESTLREYFEFVSTLLTLVKQNKVPASINLPFLERSFRLVCYYLTQLAALSSSAFPDCDPFAPIPRRS